MRFSHLVAGIAWIGSSFYFIWLDSSFAPPEIPKRNVDGELFMVHGGFYYQVEKKKIYPGEIPKVLHWFKWEATLTWITGFILFVVLYLLRGASLLIDPRVLPLSQTQAVGLSLALILMSWLIYDALWSLLKSKAASTLLSLCFFAGLIYFNTQVFSGRGAFILTGAIFGTLMLLNVWIRILPGQARMLKQAQDGQVPDYSIGGRSKIRSVHNTYLTFPVLFIMLSNHYALLYTHSWNWLILIVLSLTGALVRHAMVTKNPVERWALLPAFLGLATLIAISAPPPSGSSDKERSPAVSFEQVHTIVQLRCISCHSTHNTDDIFTQAPKGVLLENEEQISSLREKIYEQVVVTKIMPFTNKTQMTEDERQIMARWLKAVVQ